MQIVTYGIISYFLIMNLAAYIAYGRDKRLAKQKKWRTPEKVLLSLSFFGGALGALAAMQLFRHKTKHWYFHAVGIAGLLWQAALLLYLIKNGGLIHEITN
jgi:uncharacterized membrane protein YsdA (DUF1294 family)